MKLKLDACDLQVLMWHGSPLDIPAWAQELFQKSLSVDTVCRAIHKWKLKLHHAKKKPNVNTIQKRSGLFGIVFGNRGYRVLRTIEDTDHPACCRRTVQQPASLMVRGHIRAHGLESFHIWKDSINAEENIEEHLLPPRQRLLQGRPCMFQQDNAKPLTASITTRVWAYRQLLEEERMLRNAQHHPAPTFIFRCVPAIRVKMRSYLP